MELLMAPLPGALLTGQVAQQPGLRKRRPATLCF